MYPTKTKRFVGNAMKNYIPPKLDNLDEMEDS